MRSPSIHERILNICPECEPYRLAPDFLGVHTVLLERDIFERAAFGQVTGLVYINDIPLDPALVYSASMGPNGWVEIIGITTLWNRPPQILDLPQPSVCALHTEGVVYRHHVLFGDVRAEFREGVLLPAGR